MDILPIAKTIRMPCMRKGLVSYAETKEMILLEQDVLSKMAKTAFGIPVVIEHPSIQIDDETIKTIPVHGRVSGMEYDAATDEWIADFVVHTQEAVNLLQRGYGVSTGWYPRQYGPAGTYNNVPYTQSLLDAEYEHLAIVSKPRYEMAKDPIFLNSIESPCKSKEQPANIGTKQSISLGRKKTMFSLFRNKREEIKVNEGDDVMINMGAEERKLCDVVAEYKKSKEDKAAAEAPKKNMLGDDDMVDIDGESMSVKDLIAAVKASRKDASTEGERTEEDAGFKMQDEADKDSVADAVKDNAKVEAKEPAEKEEEGDEPSEKAKTNAAFDKLKEKHENGVAEEQEAWVSTHKRVEMGRARYGSATK